MSLNVGILAHVDAGKTSLTERLLWAAGVIDSAGSVDAGTTQTDTMALERQRGITIRSAVVSFSIDDVTVNLVDTPGHPDFIAEVERFLSVLDGAVLVVSAVEGVQAQTRVLMRALQRLHIPTLIFVNKIDRSGAAPDAVLQRIRDTLTPGAVGMGTALHAGTRGAGCEPHPATDAAFATRLLDLLTSHDEVLLTDWVRDQAAVGHHRLRVELAAQTRSGLVHPVFFGSATTGAGVEALTAAMTDLLPSAQGPVAGRASGTVFKVERGAAGEKVAYVRLFRGAIRVRDRLRLARGEATITALRVFERGTATPCTSAVAGQIAKVWGLAPVQIGDAIGARPTGRADRRQFSPPSLETVIEPVCPADRGALHAALTQLVEQDPLINLRQDDERREISVSLYGEVQKEVIQATLSDEYGIGVTFRGTTTICVERPVGSGTAVEFIDSDPNPFLATVGLRIDPAPESSGVEFRVEVERGSMPASFFTAVEQTVHRTLRRGLRGWAGHRLHGRDDALRVLGAAEPRTRQLRREHVQHCRRLPQPDTGGAHACTRDRGDPRLRADPLLRARAPEGHARDGPERRRAGGRRPAGHAGARLLVPGDRRHPGSTGA